MSLKRSWQVVPLVVLAAGATAFGLVAWDVANDDSVAGDAAILDLFVRHLAPETVPDLTDSLVTRAGVLGLLALGGVAVVLAARRRIGAALQIGMTIGGVVVLTSLLKGAFARPALSGSADEYSFPSGHAAGAVAAALIFAALAWHSSLRWPALAAAAILAVLHGAALVYLRWHYPSDVVGGWALAVCWAVAVDLIFRRIARGTGALVPEPPAGDSLR